MEKIKSDYAAAVGKHMHRLCGIGRKDGPGDRLSIFSGDGRPAGSVCGIVFSEQWGEPQDDRTSGQRCGKVSVFFTGGYVCDCADR